MKKDIRDFLKNVKRVNKDIAKYEDEKGNVIYFPINSAYASCTYLELNKSQYEQMVFQQTIEANDYNIIEIKTQVPKSEVTKKEEDKFTLVDSTAKVRQVWVVANQLQFTGSYKTKEEAYKIVKEIEEYIENYN